MKNLSIFVLSVMLVGCGSPSNSRRSTSFEESGAGGEKTGGTTDSSGGYVDSSAGGANVSHESGQTGGQAGSIGTGGNQAGSGTGGETISTGGTDIDGEGGEVATGGTGNVGGNCQPWDCNNLAIDHFGWDSISGESVPEICGLVQDPCTGQYIDCGGCNSVTQLSQSNPNAILEHYCGVAPPTVSELDVIPGTSDLNSCNPQCKEDNGQAGCEINEHGFVCSIKDIPPHFSCHPGIQVVPGWIGYTWCCPDYLNW